MKKFDVKSAVIGLLLGVCVVLMIGAEGNGIGDTGRYRVSPAGDSPSSCYVIDSVTGSLWRRYAGPSESYMGNPKQWGTKN